MNKIANNSDFALPPSEAFIALGANLGEPLAQIDEALRAIIAHPKIKALKLSKIYKSKPHGNMVQPDYVNAVLYIKTIIAPEDLLEFLLNIENNMGRIRTERWGPRIIDLDLIAYSDLTISNKELNLPHPLASKREFVIIPMLDFDENFMIPNQGIVKELANTFLNHNMRVIRDAQTYNS